MAAILVALAAACGEEDSGDDALCTIPPSIAGSWLGTLSDQTAGPGALSVTFTQTQCTVGGTWNGSFASAGSDGGTVSGDADGSTIEVTLFGAATCSLRAIGTINGSETTISGNYTTDNCGDVDGGTFAISRLSPTATPTSGTPTPTATASPTPTQTP